MAGVTICAGLNREMEGKLPRKSCNNLNPDILGQLFPNYGIFGDLWGAPLVTWCWIILLISSCLVTVKTSNKYITVLLLQLQLLYLPLEY